MKATFKYRHIINIKHIPIGDFLVIILLVYSVLCIETISYYNANGSNVYAFTLDASEAFDRVKCIKLNSIFKA